MKKKSVDGNIPTEVLAAYLDGNATDNNQTILLQMTTHMMQYCTLFL